MLWEKRVREISSLIFNGKNCLTFNLYLFLPWKSRLFKPWNICACILFPQLLTKMCLFKCSAFSSCNSVDLCSVTCVQMFCLTFLSMAASIACYFFFFVNLDMVVKIRQWWSPLNSEWKTKWLPPLWASDPWFPGFLPASKQSMRNLLLGYFSAVEVREDHNTHKSFLHEVQISDTRFFPGIHSPLSVSHHWSPTPLYKCFHVPVTVDLERQMLKKHI